VPTGPTLIQVKNYAVLRLPIAFRSRINHRMTKMTKALLISSILCLVAGLILNSGLVNVGEAVALYVVLPLGATFFGLFLIAKVLSKESAGYDQEHGAAGKKDRPGDDH